MAGPFVFHIGPSCIKFYFFVAPGVSANFVACPGGVFDLTGGSFVGDGGTGVAEGGTLVADGGTGVAAGGTFVGEGGTDVATGRTFVSEGATGGWLC